MADDTDQQTNPRPTSVLDELLKAIKPEKLEVLTAVKAAFIDKAFQDAVAKTTPLLDAGVKLFLTTRSELRKLKDQPDIPGSRNLEGQFVVPAGYTEKALKLIRETEEKLVKIAKALEIALSTGDFTKVSEVTKGGKGDVSGAA